MISAEALDGAFDRIEDFLSVNRETITMDAVLCLQAAVGIEDEHRALIGERVERLRDEYGQGEQTGGLLLGLILSGLALEI